MKTYLACGLAAVCTIMGNAASPPQLQVTLSDNRPRIGLAAEPVTPLAGTRYKLQLESSDDLRGWTAEGAVEPDVADLTLRWAESTSPLQFYRLRTEIEDAGTDADAAETLGYERIFREELRKVGFLTPEAFAQQHDLTGSYLQGVTFDPLTAKHWNRFSTNSDFKLGARGLELFQKNGFVVGEKLGALPFWGRTFASLFYGVLSADLPVFISSDAILHAWHFSYQRLLEEAEETQLMPALQQMLPALLSNLTELKSTLSGGPLSASVTDAQYLLAVAHLLLQKRPFGPVSADVSRTLDAIDQLQYVGSFSMFGTTRPMDFSQFKVRGHYEKSENLGRYFQAFMWLAKADLRIFTQPNDPQSLRELGTAIVLSRAIQETGQTASWRQVDDIIRLFVGQPDGMDLPQLARLTDAIGLQSPSDLKAMSQLADIQTRLREGSLGVQLYAGAPYATPFGTEQAQLPRVFAFLGQRFVSDGWALSQVTFDRVLWNEEIPGITWSRKVLRRHPSALDVAYSTLGNRQVGELIVRRMLDRAAAANFRDGYPYAHNLSALAATFDRMDSKVWEGSIYSRWLYALRALSEPTTDARYPEAMRTKAWAWRTLNTQLASYTELKHDTVLYAKQPYTGNILCEYPGGYIEPVPEFWRRMRLMAQAAESGLSALPASGIITVNPNGWEEFSVVLEWRHQARLAFCRGFADRMATLERLAQKELSQGPFTDADVGFIRGLMNSQGHDYGGPSFDGWYPGLFYEDYQQEHERVVDANGSNKSDPLVTDIHTATPDQVGSKGGVLHEATGTVDLLMIAVDSGPDRMVYAGPVLSHYEFIEPGPQMKRLSDSEWGSRLSQAPPARPEWTQSYMAPR